MDNWAQHFVVCWFSTIFLLSYNFLQFDEFIFSFQDTYNNCLNKRNGDDPSTHPDLWLEARSFGEPYRNRVYGLSNTTAENLWTACNVLIIGCSQLVMSNQTPKFKAMLDQRVQEWTTHLNEKFQRLVADYE
jgi:hypothetical protein